MSDESACMPDEKPCAKKSCDNSVTDYVAARTDGLCVPCDRARILEEFKKLTNPLDIVLLLFREEQLTKLSHDYEYPPEKPVDLCMRMKPTDIQRLIDHMSNLASIGCTDIACELGVTLLRAGHCDLNDALIELLEYSLDDDEYPGFVFLNASPHIRDELIDRIEENPSSILSALAWIGDKTVIEQFTKWRKVKPEWAQSLYCEPHEYAKIAGWELTAEGTRRNLFYENCFPFSPSSTNNKSAASAFTDAGEQCPFCKAPLTNILDCNASAPELNWLKLERPELRFLTCMFCVCFTENGMKARVGSGAKELAPVARFVREPEDGAEEEIPENTLKLDSTPRRMYYSCGGDAEKRISQIGGHPTWVQDPSYPQCAGCGVTMHLFGQVAMADIDPDIGEGVYYCFLCDKCKKCTAVDYQQS